MFNLKSPVLAALALTLLASCITLSGCKIPKSDDSALPAAHANMDVPTYGHIREKYNERAGKVQQLWARAIIEMNYVDSNGKRKFEQGEGHLIYVKPDWVSLSMGKLGNTILWAGRDPTTYWLFVMGDEKVAYTGKLGSVDSPAQRRLNIPISLDHIILLSGLEELPEESADKAAPTVVAEGSQLLVKLPGSNLDMLIDPTTWLPTQIRVFRNDKLELTSTLSRPDSVAIGNQPPGAFPLVQTRIQIDYADRKDTLVLFLSGLTDGVEDDKIKFGVFQFETLRKVLKPDRVVDMDDLATE